MGFWTWLGSKLAVGGAQVASPQQRNPQTKAPPAPAMAPAQAMPPPAPAPAPGVTASLWGSYAIPSDALRTLLGPVGVPYAVAGQSGPVTSPMPRWRIAPALPIGAGSVSVSQ